MSRIASAARTASSFGPRTAIIAFVLLWSAGLGSAQPAVPPSSSPPAAPPGWDLFARKGCARCHQIRGFGTGTVGPDLARIDSGVGFFEIAAAMWNHVPQMRIAMREQGVQWPSLTPQELSDIIELLFGAQRNDVHRDPVAGQRLFALKGCDRCHGESRDEQRPGPPRRELARSTASPALLTATMWNHAVRVASVRDDAAASRSSFAGSEFEDLVAFLAASGDEAQGEAVRVLVGVPDRGRRLFTSAGCTSCHIVSNTDTGSRTTLAPRASRPTVAALPGVLWNHADIVRSRRVRVSRVTGTEMADIEAYLHASFYFDPPHGDRKNGERLVDAKGCLRCHAIYKKGAGTAPNFATSNVTASQLGQLSAMWNHGRQMHNEATRRAVVLPRLTARELGDITTYLAGLGSGAPKAR